MAVSYNFYYVYDVNGNSDYYWGTGYTDANTSLVYQANPVLYTSPNETGSAGYYYIYNVTNLGDGVGTEGFVRVDSYYDVETGTTATSLYDYYTGTLGYGAGYAGLGSELGYAYNPDLSNPEILFGAAYYEADLAVDSSGRVTADDPNSPGPGNPVNLAPDPNEWNVTYLEDSDAWETATKLLNANNELIIPINDDPYFEYFENGDEFYTLDLLNANGLGFTQDTYIVNEGDGFATIGLSSFGPFTTAKFIIQDDDWNNDFANAISLNEIALGAGFDDSFISDDSTTIGATKELGEPNHAGNTGGASIWWSWTASSTGLVQITTDGSDFDTTLGIYTGSSFSNLTEVVSNDDDPYGSQNGDRDSLVIFEAIAGTTYQIAVDGYQGATGDVNLTLEALDNYTLFSSSFSNNLSIPDLGTVNSGIFVASLPRPVADVDVTLSIDHTYDADLQAFLISPSGTRVELFAGVGGSEDNFRTTLDDEAATSITFGSAPFIGSFSPTGFLSSFDGENPNGTWSLEITDNAGADIGTLNDWSLTFNF